MEMKNGSRIEVKDHFSVCGGIEVVSSFLLKISNKSESAILRNRRCDCIENES